MHAGAVTNIINYRTSVKNGTRLWQKMAKGALSPRPYFRTQNSICGSIYETNLMSHSNRLGNLALRSITNIMDIPPPNSKSLTTSPSPVKLPLLPKLLYLSQSLYIFPRTSNRRLFFGVEGVAVTFLYLLATVRIHMAVRHRTAGTKPRDTGGSRNLLPCTTDGSDLHTEI